MISGSSQTFARSLAAEREELLRAAIKKGAITHSTESFHRRFINTRPRLDQFRLFVEAAPGLAHWCRCPRKLREPA